MNPNLRAAQEYAGRGWPVFPIWWPEDGRCACGDPDCSHPGKHPIGKLATRDPSGRKVIALAYLIEANRLSAKD
jgi:hypothetical protein